jgi:hypothetical protein
VSFIDSTDQLSLGIEFYGHYKIRRTVAEENHIFEYILKFYSKMSGSEEHDTARGQ